LARPKNGFVFNPKILESVLAGIDYNDERQLGDNRNHVTRTARMRRSSPSMAWADAKIRVSSIFARVSAFPAKFMPIPIIAEVRESPSSGSFAAFVRLNPMAQPPSQVSERFAHMRRPIEISVLLSWFRYCGA